MSKRKKAEGASVRKRPQQKTKRSANQVLQRSDEHKLAQHALSIRRLSGRVMEDLIEIGRRLIECKRICGHGNWLPWLEREFGWEETTAQRFMRVHELALSKSGKLPNLPVSAIYLLAAPSTPASARDEIIERVEAGEKLLVTEVREAIEEAKAEDEEDGDERDLNEIARDALPHTIVRALLTLSLHVHASEHDIAAAAELLRGDKQQLTMAVRGIKLAVRVLEALGGRVEVEEEHDVRPRFLRVEEEQR